MSTWPDYGALSDEETVYVGQLIADPTDYTTRQVYADWLEDHDRPEDADFQRGISPRAWQEAGDYLHGYHERLSYARAYGYPPGDPGLDPRDYNPPFWFEEMLDGAHSHLDGGYGLTLPFDTPNFVYEEVDTFWQHFAVYTGRRIKPTDGKGYGRGPGKFLSCSC